MIKISVTEKEIKNYSYILMNLFHLSQSSKLLIYAKMCDIIDIYGIL